jgi:two-component system phosphate regulon sensor histidine kinase PhoR
VRRLLLVNALIFAVLAAAIALAYVGSRASSVSRDSERQLMYDLAQEKVLGIEQLIVDADRRVFRDVRLGESPKLDEALVQSLFVLDDGLRLVPGGYVTRRNPKEGVEVRDWFLDHVLPRLPLAKQPLDERGHLYGVWDGGPLVGRPFLFSFTRKVVGERTYYVVVEDGINYLAAFVFPQSFPARSPYLYQVVDERGGFRWGYQYTADPDTLATSVPFVDSVDGWELHVTEKDVSVRRALHRKRIVDSVLIGGAVTVILAGLAFLAIAIRRERRSNELKSEFISNVSHELKTPLSIISMFGEMLANGRTKGPEQATEYAEIIWRESVRLGRLIDNVLDFAKIERGMGVYEFAEADVGEVVSRAIDLVQRRLAAAEMTLDAELAPGLPPILLDANAFTLAVLNLIDNAIKYAAEGKKVQLALRREGDRIVLTVRDRGPGIAPDEQDRIFERFYRSRAVRLKPIRGSGIGLALVQHIARAHRGDVSVTSEPGQGSTFQLWLPI